MSSTSSSSSASLQNLLDEALNNFFPNNYPFDISFNNMYIPLFREGEGEGGREEEEKETDSLPDLIPLEPEPEQEPEQELEPEHPPQIQVVDQQRRQLTLWSDLVRDYNSQINSYQQNIQSILRITEHLFIPSSSVQQQQSPPPPPPTNNRTFVSQIRDWLRNSTGNDYVLEFENITQYLFTNQNQNQNQNQNPSNLVTTQEIQNATELFVNDSSNNILAYNTCPISLEEFREGEPLMRIRHCGHIFKAFELQRWFLRNTKCPSCRYDIRYSSPPPSSNLN